MMKKVFFISFFCACLLQGIRWTTLSIIDQGMWANQAEYVETNNPQQFNPLTAYGHPGGPIIEGTIALHHMGLSYNNALIFFLVVCNGFFIAVTCVLAWLLNKNRLWWISVLGILSMHPLYSEVTPTSAVVAILLSCLCLLTLYLLEYNGTIKNKHLIIWSFIAGFAIATRTDVATITTFVFAAILFPKIGFRKICAVMIGAFVSFCVLDPFMWYMPIQHIKGLIDKVTLHYAHFQPYSLPLGTVVEISLLAGISMMFSIVFMSWKSKLSLPVSKRFIIGLIVLTIGLYCIFLTAHFQAIRYFVPIIFMWELLLPVFLFSLVDSSELPLNKPLNNMLSTREEAYKLLLFILISYPALIFIYRLTQQFIIYRTIAH